MNHLKFFLQSPHAPELPLRVGFPVLRDRWHCLQRSTPQLLHLILSEEPQPDENLHIYKIIIFQTTNIHLIYTVLEFISLFRSLLFTSYPITKNTLSALTLFMFSWWTNELLVQVGIQRTRKLSRACPRSSESSYSDYSTSSQQTLECRLIQQ